jgi:hypothetical protein
MNQSVDGEVWVVPNCTCGVRARNITLREQMQIHPIRLSLHHSKLSQAQPIYPTEQRLD